MKNHLIKIGITDCLKYKNYEQWFLDSPEGVEPVQLSYKLDNAAEIESCEALVLSGGEDIHPKRYNKPEYLQYLNQEYINEERDHFEWQVIEKALALKKPILGICRGLQKMNTYLGGTLIYDIPSVVGDHGHTRMKDEDQRHPVKVKEHSLLHAVTGHTTGIINSAHHQSVDQLAPSLVVTGTSGKDIIEALEWKKPEGKPWLLLVQWHPERMPDQENPFAARIREAFLKTIIHHR